jgi:alpha-ribazole phosphatase
MPIYLIRHTKPRIEKGVCYGQSDIDVTETFHDEAAIISAALPEKIMQVYSSPLSRCKKLAEHLFPAVPVSYENDLQEIHCGEWEMLYWDAIPREIIDPWMKDFVNVQIPGGESYVQLFDRVIACYEKIIQMPKPVAIVAHGGVIRSILAHITNTPLIDSFGAFSIHYGCVIRIDRQGEKWNYESLSNISTGKEQHKPML